MDKFSPAAMREARESAGLTREELAVKVGAAFKTVRDWEVGNAVPRRVSLSALSVALGVNQSDLMETAQEGERS